MRSARSSADTRATREKRARSAWFPSCGAQVLGSAGARSPALRAPLRFPAMAPGARVGAARGGHPLARSKRLDLDYPGRSVANYPLSLLRLPRATHIEPPGPALNFPNEQAPGHHHPSGGSLSLIPFPGAGGARSWAGHSRAGVPQTHPAERVEALQPPQQQRCRPIGRRWHRERRSRPVHSPRVPSGLLPTYSKVGPKWPPREFSGARLRHSSAPRAGSRVCRAPGWGRRAASCPREQLARALRVPLFQGSAGRPARASPRSPRPPGADPRAAHAPRRGGYPSAPGHARSRRRSFLPRGNSRPYFLRGGRTSPSPRARGREAWPRGQGAPGRYSDRFLARRSV